jgi:hypothetical protein
MSAHTGRAVVVVTIFAVLVTTRSSRAMLDPDRARVDTAAALRDDVSFCRAPHTPLSRRARALCPHADAIPDCRGFAAACAKADTEASSSQPPRRSRNPPPVNRLSIPSFVATFARALVWLLVGGLVLVVLVPLVRALARMRRDKALTDPAREPAIAEARARAPDADSTTDEEALLHRAGQLANQGQKTTALQLYLAASLRALDKRGSLRLEKHRTNGEYVRSCTEGRAGPGLREIVREVDRVQFGREEATDDAVMRTARRAEAIVRALPTMLLVLALSSLAGCDADERVASAAGDDPAGDELLFDVLRRQGVRARPLKTALASLPLPNDGERLPAVVIDLERIEIDAETRAHLLEWTGAGGVLVLAGAPEAWPREIGAGAANANGEHALIARRLLARLRGHAKAFAGDDEGPVYASSVEHGQLASDAAVKFQGVVDRVAWFPGQLTYAAVVDYGRGYVLAIASDELLTNAGLARPGNAAVMMAILSNADRLEFEFAQPEDGVSPPSTPMAALMRAGLGLGLAHGLMAALALFLAVGVRLVRPKPAPPPLRRAFAEHVEAVGTLYRRTGSARHALAAYARFVDGRLRARMPRGWTDVGSFLASRARVPQDVCERLWGRATSARTAGPNDPPAGDELAVLRDLGAVYSAAVAQDK